MDGGVEGDGRNSKPLYYYTHYCEILLDLYLHARSFVFLFLHELQMKTSKNLCPTGLEAGSPISGDDLLYQIMHHIIPAPRCTPHAVFVNFINLYRCRCLVLPNLAYMQLLLFYMHVELIVSLHLGISPASEPQILPGGRLDFSCNGTISLV